MTLKRVGTEKYYLFLKKPNFSPSNRNLLYDKVMKFIFSNFYNFSKLIFHFFQNLKHLILIKYFKFFSFTLINCFLHSFNTHKVIFNSKYQFSMEDSNFRLAFVVSANIKHLCKHVISLIIRLGIIWCVLHCNRNNFL